MARQLLRLAATGMRGATSHYRWFVSRIARLRARRRTTEDDLISCSDLSQMTGDADAP
jgi:hypothetical protein